MKNYTAKNLDEALELVIKEKECKKEDIFYEVIEENKHFLGIGNSITISAYTNQDIKDFIFDYLGNYFINLNQEVAIEIILENDLFRVVLDAENNAIIIGKGGQTLRAISNVLKAATNNTFKKRVNIIVDVNHYKEDRYRKIRSLANRVAKEVAKTHVDAALDPMPNDERKVIHEFLAKRNNIKTESEGEGNQRHLVIKYVEEK